MQCLWTFTYIPIFLKRYTCGIFFWNKSHEIVLLSTGFWKILPKKSAMHVFSRLPLIHSSSRRVTSPDVPVGAFFALFNHTSYLCVLRVSTLNFKFLIRLPLNRKPLFLEWQTACQSTMWRSFNWSQLVRNKKWFLPLYPIYGWVHKFTFLWHL